jgi:hypothetical protein
MKDSDSFSVFEKVVTEFAVKMNLTSIDQLTSHVNCSPIVFDKVLLN